MRQSPLIPSVKIPIIFEPFFGFVQKGHQRSSSLKAITPFSLMCNTFIIFSHNLFQYISFEIMFCFRTFLHLVEGAQLVLPASNLPSAMSLLASVSHTAVFLQLLSTFIYSCNKCQINVILLSWSQIWKYLLGKKLHQQEAKLHSNCHLFKRSFLEKQFPLLNSINQLLLTSFYIAPLNFKTQNPSSEHGKIL